MRDRLIELIKQGDKTFADKYEGKVMSHIDEVYEFIADYLIDNGVVLLPCKVGQTVFRLVKLHGDGYTKIVEGTVFEVATTYEYCGIKHRFYFWEKGTTSKHINRYSLWCEFDQIGKSVFLSREDAEAKLKGGEGK